jgi:hypothetical protein
MIASDHRPVAEIESRRGPSQLVARCRGASHVEKDSIEERLHEIDSARAELRLQLDRVPEQAISERPAGGEWSILENMRHLLFAEQLHMSRLFGIRPTWSPEGYTPEAMRAARKLPPISSDDPTLNDVWDAWDSVHAETVSRFSDSVPDGAVVALTRHLSHLRRHLSEIEKLLRRVAPR